MQAKTRIRKHIMLLSFLVPVLLTLFVFLARGIFPFGSQSFLRTDLYHQYAPFFSELQQKMRNGGSLAYSFDIGLGTNFMALFSYYLSSPFNLFLLFVPSGNVIEFITYLTVLKIGFCGLAMSLYLRRHYHKKDSAVLFFSLFYAMSGYLCAYSWNIMWLDCIYLFPLVILGAENIFQEGHPFLYILTLSLSIISNYYISIMICLYLVLYFFAYPFLREEKTEEKTFFRRGLIFLLASLLSGMFAGITLLPEFFALRLTASSSVSFPKEISQYFTILDMAARHMTGVATEQGLDHWPNIYCGVIVFFLLPMYFLNRQIRFRKKMAAGLLLLFFFLSFSVNILNYIWHGLHYPNSLPCRQSFIYIFLVLSMCYDAFLHRKFWIRQETGIALLTALSLLLLSQKVITENEDISFTSVYLSLGFLLLYYGIFLWRPERRFREWKLIALLCFGMLEAMLNTAITSVPTTSRTQYLSDRRDTEILMGLTKAQEPAFYRFMKEEQRTKNDGAFLHFPSASIFSSTAYREVSDQYRLFGMEASTNAYSTVGATPLMKSLLSIRYSFDKKLLSGEEMLEEGKELLGSSGEINLYERKETLPFGFLLTKNEFDSIRTDQGTPALVQNGFADALSVPPVLVSVLAEMEGERDRFTAENAGEYFAYVSNRSVKEVKVSYKDRDRNFENVDRGYFLPLGYLKEGESVSISSKTEGQSLNCELYRFDEASLHSLYERLASRGMKLKSMTDHSLEGTFSSDGNEMLFFSIPYDEGWRIILDGEAAQAEKAFGAFLSVPVTRGEHEIKLCYVVPGLRTGMLLSGSALALFLLLLLTEVHQHRKKRKIYQKKRGQRGGRYRETEQEENPEQNILPMIGREEAAGSGDSCRCQSALEEVDPFETGDEPAADAADPEKR